VIVRGTPLPPSNLRKVLSVKKLSLDFRLDLGGKVLKVEGLCFRMAVKS
jgi:hypothetical protein